jgi:hypothetical protein
METTSRSDRQLLTPEDVERDYLIPVNSQAIWRHANRYGFRDLAYKVGSNVRYRRVDLEKWLESRRASALVDRRECR